MNRNNNLKDLARIILQGKNNNSYIQFFRYFFVGGAAFLVDTSIVVYLTDYLKAHYVVSVVAGFIIGILINYILSSIWVFHRNSKNISKSQHLMDIAIFAIIGVTGLLLTIAIVWLLFDILAFSILFSKIVASAIVLFWNFIGRKYLVFHRREIIKSLKSHVSCLK